MDPLFRTLNRLASDAQESFYGINNGGCAVFASLVALRLQKMGIPVWIRVAEDSEILEDDGFPNVDEVRMKILSNAVDNWNENGIKFGHVLVQFEFDGQQWVYDSHGIAPEGNQFLRWYGSHNDTQLYPGKMSVQEMIELSLHSKSGWNMTFNRANIPALTKMISTAFATLN